MRARATLRDDLPCLEDNDWIDTDILVELGRGKSICYAELVVLRQQLNADLTTTGSSDCVPAAGVVGLFTSVDQIVCAICSSTVTLTDSKTTASAMPLSLGFKFYRCSSWHTRMGTPARVTVYFSFCWLRGWIQ